MNHDKTLSWFFAWIKVVQCNCDFLKASFFPISYGRTEGKLVSVSFQSLWKAAALDYLPSFAFVFCFHDLRQTSKNIYWKLNLQLRNVPLFIHSKKQDLREQQISIDAESISMSRQFFCGFLTQTSRALVLLSRQVRMSLRMGPSSFSPWGPITHHSAIPSSFHSFSSLGIQTSITACTSPFTWRHGTTRDH